VSFSDVDRDGDLDLAAGSWWGPVRIYENQGGTIPTGPTWQSGTGSVIENIVWEDVNNDAVASPTLVVRTGDGLRRFFDTGYRPVRFLEVRVDGVVVPPTHYFAAPEHGWLVLPSAPAPQSQVRIRCTVPAAPDFAVSNWDATVGDYLFLNDFHPAVAPAGVEGGISLSVCPNPSTGTTHITWQTRSGLPATCDVVTVGGARVRQGEFQNGVWNWDGRGETGQRLPAGVYWIRVQEDGRVEQRRIVLVR
jgi:hypothetical protein